AARRWYFDFFRPLASRVRKRRLGRAFPGERTADIVVRLRAFRSEEARLGHEVSWERALEHFAAAYDSTHPWRIWDPRRALDLSRLVPFGRRRAEPPEPESPPADGATQAERSPPR
ncbi:MAG TPA: hypothetical protein VHQ00_08775, partial [Chloroflexota bacterium]|nr:hypothetical protein [Chloroflexota bacterium]